MQRLVHDLVDGRELDQLAGVHDAHLVGELGDQAHFMADEDDRGAGLLLQPAQRRHHLALHHHVQGAGRFVGDDQLGLERGRRSHGHALLHTAAQLVGKHARHAGIQPHMLQQRVDLCRETRLLLFS